MRRNAARLTLAASMLATLISCSSRWIPSDYASWERITKTPTTDRIPGHEERFRITYINDEGETLTSTVKNGVRTWDYPRGTIIVKEGYAQPQPPSAGDSPSRVYAMIKRPEDPRAKGGWVWVVRDRAGSRETVVDGPYCVDCHSYANQQNPYGDKNPQSDFRDDVYVLYVPDTGS